MIYKYKPTSFPQPLQNHFWQKKKGKKDKWGIGHLKDKKNQIQVFEKNTFAIAKILPEGATG